MATHQINCNPDSSDPATPELMRSDTQKSVCRTKTRSLRGFITVTSLDNGA